MGEEAGEEAAVGVVAAQLQGPQDLPSPADAVDQRQEEAHDDAKGEPQTHRLGPGTEGGNEEKVEFVSSNKLQNF